MSFVTQPQARRPGAITAHVVPLPPITPVTQDWHSPKRRAFQEYRSRNGAPDPTQSGPAAEMQVCSGFSSFPFEHGSPFSPNCLNLLAAELDAFARPFQADTHTAASKGIGIDRPAHQIAVNTCTTSDHMTLANAWPRQHQVAQTADELQLHMVLTGLISPEPPATREGPAGRDSPTLLAELRTSSRCHTASPESGDIAMRDARRAVMCYGL
eukprot:NODE_3350_length_907_cov_63.228205_g3328_i0.p1 GENE.NODE_3350_length_907_cov_63.228205_g3328_i0~~NODE_3350_length_907_cov_63.228205_g3328_i0.p1  ORF type:complete len:212 (-),score=12.23 NODE_3350_length_907_cov_63.228205_g3328_i0:72-707(-)